jgi:CRISPR-associated endoribonuclease Cas6
VKAADADLATELHQQSAVKPFTLSPLTEVSGGQRMLHVTLLDDDLWPTLLSGLQSRPSLDVHGRDFPLASHGLQMDYASYAQLARASLGGRYIDLRFVTPTCFRAGDLDYPLPEPRKLSTSWLSRWNQYAPEALVIEDDLLDAAWAHVGVSSFEMRTETVDLGYGKQVGYLGELSLCIVNADELGRDRRRQLHGLASYAAFCGSGVKTTHGMGQTRRIRSR